MSMSTVLSFSVNKLKQETDVMINIPDSDHGTTTIRIEGNKEGVMKAKKVSSQVHYTYSENSFRIHNDDRSIC